MKRLGKVLHVSKRGFIIVRSDKSPPMGPKAIVVDKKVKKIGTIQDVFGPVKNPYIAIRPFKGIELTELVGQLLYLFKK